MQAPIRSSLLAMLSLAFSFSFFSCKKNEIPVQPDPDANRFAIVFDNRHSEIQEKYAAWLTDQDGRIIAFRWLKGNDTTQLVVQNFDQNSPNPDLNLLKISALSIGAQTDTSAHVQTFTRVGNGSNIVLQDNEYLQTTDLEITFSNVSNVDTIIVPDGLPFARPGWWNNYYGYYRIRHTGNFWLRLQYNGDLDHWYYMAFDNVASGKVTVAIDPKILPLQAYPKNIQLPFVANWKYRVDGVVDKAKQQFTALGDLNRPPGGALPNFGQLQVFEPATFDPLAPPILKYNGYRFKISGTNIDGRGYHYDHFLTELPAKMPDPAFNLQPNSLGDNRLASVKCSGDIDAVALIRKNNGRIPITWEVLLPAEPILTHRLPDVPTEVGNVFPDLKNYEFGNAVRARAESYQSLQNYPAVVQRMFKNDSPFWQAEAGFLGLEIGL